MGVREALPTDAAQLAEIYNPYVIGTIITFEETPLTEAEMRARMVPGPGDVPWLVFEDGGRVDGFAYASAWKSRCAYRHAAEVTVYVREGRTGAGIGRELYESLTSRLFAAGMHTLLGGIALPNEASIALHERMGFRKVAHFEQVGFKLGRRIDVGYWQLTRDRSAAEADHPEPFA